MEAVGVVRDLVVVSVSNTKAARDSLVDNGVEEKERIEERRCERMVVLPEPDSPLQRDDISNALVNIYKAAPILTERPPPDFLPDLPILTKLFRPIPRPRPWRYPISRHLGLL